MSEQEYLGTNPMVDETEAIGIGDTFRVSESFRPRDILLYMGATGDMNPRYLGQQSEANGDATATGTVPIIAVIGVLTRTVSMHFPGVNSEIVECNYAQSVPIPVGSTLTFNFEVIRKDTWRSLLMIHVTGENELTNEDNVMDAMLTVLLRNDQAAHADTTEATEEDDTRDE